ncbi:MAG: carbohydrate ABC transporter permease [Acidimicrobiales bacterium]
MTRRLKHVGLNVVGALAIVFMLVPFLWTILESFHGSDVFAPVLSLFRPSLSNYRYVLLHTAIPREFLNSLIACASALAVSIPVACMAAYGYSRLRFRGRSVLFYGVLITQLLPATALVIPLYRVWSLAHAFNDLVALGVAYAAVNMALAILLMRNFFDNLPRALDDAANIDGCSRFQTFWYILRPLVMPAVAASAVFVFVNAWQDYLLASSLITNSADFTVNVGLYAFEGAFTTDWGAILASSVLVSVPSVLMFALAQRYFVRVASGGVKE